MNLDGFVEVCGRFEPLPASGFMDSWHFSAWNKEGEKDFYAPICEGIRRQQTA